MLLLLLTQLSFGQVESKSEDKSENKSESEELNGLIFKIDSLAKIKKNASLKIARSDKNKIVPFPANFNFKEPFKLDPLFLAELVLFTPNQYLYLFNNPLDQCQFMALLDNDLLKTAQSQIQFIPLSHNNEIINISKNDFIKGFQQHCFAQKEIKVLFNVNNFGALIEKLDFQIPSELNSCLKIFRNWKKNPYTPYLCRIYEVVNQGQKLVKNQSQEKAQDILTKRKIQNDIARANFITKNVGPFKLQYLKNLCENLNDETNYCMGHLQEPYWNKILRAEKSLAPIKYRCSELLNLKSLNSAHYQDCVKSLINNPELCLKLNQDTFGSIYPKENCAKISQALQFGRLRADYMDCPLKIGHGGLVNSFRILSHFSPQIYQSNSNNCAYQSVLPIIQLALESGNDQLWNYKICYYDNLDQQDKCFPYIGGHYKFEAPIQKKPLSEENETTLFFDEENVLSQVVGKVLGTTEKINCQIISSEKFKPLLLEFKKGCFAVYNPQECNVIHCPKKIYSDMKLLALENLNNENITELDSLKNPKIIKYLSGLNWSYLPFNYKEEQYSMSSLLINKLKLHSLPISNLTELQNFFKIPKFGKSKKMESVGIIHGVGCMEDLLPHQFRIFSMNQCQELPFIIDGSFSENGSDWVVIRLSIDDVQTPRLILWNHVFSAVKSFQNIHPLRMWSLNGLTQNKLNN